jgi:hypothetical protein
MSRISSMIILGALLSAVIAGKAAAQWNVARFGTEPNRAYTSVGLDPAIVTTVGYARVTTMKGHPIQWMGDVGVVAAGMDASDFRARLSMQTSLVQWRSVYFTGSATAITRGTENAIYRGVNFGADLSGSLGVYRQRWFAAGEFGFDKAIITHVTHSDYYKRYFYPDAKDGWYLDAGGTYHGGIAGGLAIGRSEIVARAGLLKTERFKELTPPMYVSVGMGFGF